MKVGYASHEITPIEPSYLCGHAIRTEISKGTLDPLYVSCVILDVDGKKKCWYSFDLVMLDRDFTIQLQKVVSNIIECNEYEVVCSVIHTHSGPEVSEKGVFSETSELGARPGYSEFLFAKCMEALYEALAHLEEANVRYDSFEIEGCFGNRNGKEHPADKECICIQFYTSDRVLLTCVNFACHPTVLGPQNLYFSADIFGSIRNRLQEKWNSSVFMMQGAAGDMGTRQFRQGEDNVELSRLTDLLDIQFNRNWNWINVKSDEIKTIETHFEIDEDIDLSELQIRYDENKRKLDQETNHDQIKLLNSGLAALKFQMQHGTHYHADLDGSIWKIGKLCFVCLPCELFNQLGVKIKNAGIDEKIIIWGYAFNGGTSIGYLVDEPQYGKSYESIATCIKKGTPEKYCDYIISKLDF
ncbi:hypothetical protein [Anaerorhabdus sp.]|uniref:hypothetical protein n=1 Tax=Anaerorhabdus sp. TaxID=1872524 RepID=UPI002FC98884